MLRRIVLLFICGGLLAAADPVSISMDGRSLTVNGQERVPVGLFGLHAVHLTPELVEDLGVTCYRHINFIPSGGSKFIGKGTSTIAPVYEPLEVLIDCQGDRFYEPLVLRNKNYAETCAEIGKRYGELWKRLAAETGKRGIVQWWNEPYLNWAERSAGGRASTISQQWYDIGRAVEGGPVHLKGWDEPLSYFQWQRLWPTRYVEGTDKKGKPFRKRIIGWSVDVPAGIKEGDSFEAAETRYWREPGKLKTWTLEEHWFPRDRTRVSFWSGRQNLEFYMMMYGPWAKALREANPDVTILGGWDFNYSAANWACWLELYRPLLQNFPDHIDGMTDHHYGIPPTIVQAWYELGTAEGMVFTGRWLKNWNTECQGRLDPAVYGKTSNAPGGSDDPKVKALWEANYNLADMIGLAARMPGKVGSRTAHNFAGKGFSQCGAAWALRLLKPLRGRLLRVDSGDQGCWAVAAKREDGGLVLAVYNNRPQDRTLALDLPAEGVVTAHTLDRAGADDPDGTTLAIRQAAVADDGQFPLPSRSAVVFTWQGTAGEQLAKRQQFFTARPGLRRWLGNAKKPLGMDIDIPEESVASAKQAWLRIVLTDQPGQLSGSLNDKVLSFERDQPVTDLPIEVDALKAGANNLSLTAERPFLLVGASLILEQ